MPLFYLSFQPNLNQEYTSDAGPAPPYQLPAPFNVAVPTGQGVNSAVFQQVLPSELWPHNFLIFSILSVAVLGALNVFTLPLTISAMLLAIAVSKPFLA